MVSGQKRIYEKAIDYLKMDIVKRYKSTSFIEFRNNLEHLFDICSCSCLLISCEESRPPCRSKNCDGFHIDCICAIKIPKTGKQFLINQRGSRLIRICPISGGARTPPLVGHANIKSIPMPHYRWGTGPTWPHPNDAGNIKKI